MVGEGFGIKVSGFLVAKELEAFAKVLDTPAKPVLAILGGAFTVVQLLERTTYVVF